MLGHFTQSPNVTNLLAAPAIRATMSFTCPICGRVSHHPEDERRRFCGVCGFVDDPRRMRPVDPCRFDKLVFIEHKRAGTTTRIVSVREAADCLIGGG